MTSTLGTPSLASLGVPDLTQGWVDVAASQDRRRVTVQLRADLPGRYYSTLRLLGRKVPCVSSGDALGAQSALSPYFCVPAKLCIN